MLGCQLQKCHCIAISVLAILVTAQVAERPGWAQEGNQFDGAIWSFTLTPKQKGMETLKGIFRVSNNELFQKEARLDKDYTKKVGKNVPRGKRTRIEITDLRAFAKDRSIRKGIKGTARLSIDKFGEWSGVFTDEKGRNWEFKCSRVQE